MLKKKVRKKIQVRKLKGENKIPLPLNIRLHYQLLLKKMEIKAVYHNGIITVSIPKKEEVKAIALK